MESFHPTLTWNSWTIQQRDYLIGSSSRQAVSRFHGLYGRIRIVGYSSRTRLGSVGRTLVSVSPLITHKTFGMGTSKVIKNVESKCKAILLFREPSAFFSLVRLEDVKIHTLVFGFPFFNGFSFHAVPRLLVSCKSVHLLKVNQPTNWKC